MDLNKKFNIQALKRDGETVIDFLDRHKNVIAIGGSVFIATKLSTAKTVIDAALATKANSIIVSPLSTFGIAIPKWFTVGVPAIIISGTVMCKLLEDDKFKEKNGDLVAKITLIGGIALMYIICFEL